MAVPLRIISSIVDELTDIPSFFQTYFPNFVFHTNISINIHYRGLGWNIFHNNLVTLMQTGRLILNRAFQWATRYRSQFGSLGLSRSEKAVALRIISSIVDKFTDIPSLFQTYFPNFIFYTNISINIH